MQPAKAEESMVVTLDMRGVASEGFGREGVRTGAPPSLC